MCRVISILSRYLVRWRQLLSKKDMFNIKVKYTEYKTNINTKGIFKYTIELIIKKDAVQSFNVAALMYTQSIH